jgi:FMN phosphatase YigB (HAD superfamily)
MAVEAKMKQLLENWKRYLIEDMYEPKTITFDFDNTIMMTRPDEDWGQVVDGPNKDVIKLMKRHKQMGDQVIVVTSRMQRNETGGPYDPDHPAHMPSVAEYLEKYGIDVDRILFTDGDLKAETLVQINSDLHFDDDEEELNAADEKGIKTVQIRNPHYAKVPQKGQ